MKKNTMMRVASVLLVAVLLSTCAISGTFAKYVTTATANDTARIAYWGFNEPTNVVFNLFQHNDGAVIANDADTTTNLIAPGTSGSASLALTYSAKGNINAPEVAYNYSVSVAATGDTDTLNALDRNQNFVWKYKNQEYQTFDQFAAAVASSEDVPAGQLPAAQNYTIGWEWKYTDAYDSTDTEMGNATDLESITVTFTIVATQLNDAPTQNS